MDISIIIPAKNESSSIGNLLAELKAHQPGAEILVINDGSTDDTEQIAKDGGAKVISHPYSMGNGAAIKTGARNANNPIIVCMDADGQHRPEDIQRLLELLSNGYDMAVGARVSSTQASAGRRFANNLYNKLASFMTGHEIMDLTSGFRAMRRRHFLKFLYLLPNGFSYPTTSTMAFFRSGLPVGYIPILARQRDGKSNIRILRDGLRFFIIILKIGALFSPMRFFLPVSFSLLALGAVYYGYTYIEWGRLTNMTVILWVSSLLTFLIGIISEQISSLHYRHADEDIRRTRRDN